MFFHDMRSSCTFQSIWSMDFSIRLFTQSRFYQYLEEIRKSLPLFVQLIGPWEKKLMDFFRCVIFELISVIGSWGISCKIALRWLSPDLTDDLSTWVQVMACCLMATSHYLNPRWPNSMQTYGVTHHNVLMFGSHVHVCASKHINPLTPGRQDMKFIFGITSPRPEVLYIANVKITSPH